jgi:mono/diheme cytochrome c family protein
MKKWLKRAALALAALVVLAGGAVFAGLQLADGKMQRKVDVAVQPVALRTDAQSLERGKYLFASRGCVDCHGANGGGKVFVDDGKGLRIKGPNISPGAGSVVARYEAIDWVRTIRHGVGPGSRPLMIMPSEDYNRFTDDDLASLVAYVRALPPVAGGPAEVILPLPARVLYGFGAIEDAAGKIDHSQPAPPPVPEAVSLQHGAYVANMCLGCHGPQLVGGRIPGGPPDWPAAANLRQGEGTVMTAYADPQALLKLFRTGKRADGSAVKVMPFDSLREMSETDVKALHLYLQSLKSLAKG